MIKNYLKIAFKVMLRRKYYTFLTLLGISFTIMVVTVAGTLIDHVIGANYPEPHRNRTLFLKNLITFKDGKENWGNPSNKFFQKYITRLQSPEGIAIYSENGGFISNVNKKLRNHMIKYTDAGFWRITAFNFIEGKPYSESDLKNGSQVVVINEALRNHYFGNNLGVGKSILIYGKQFKVIGVVENTPLLSNVNADAWIPYTVSINPVRKEREFQGSYKIMLLAKTEAEIPKLKSELQNLLKRTVNPGTEADSVKAEALTVLENFVMKNGENQPNYSKTIGSIFLVMVLFMLIPALSLINLNITRISERAAEIGIRKSFGASSGALVGQFIVENILLTLIGGLIGFLLSILATDGLIAILNAFDPLYKIPSGQFIINERVFGFCVFASVFFGLFSGVYPAFKMSRLHPVQALKGGSI